MSLAFVALGANLADPAAQVRAGIEALPGLPGSRLVRASSLYRSAPVGIRGQPDFVNAVAAVETELTPHALLDALLAIEAHFGRRRDFPRAPRTLDLDLLLYDAETIETPELAVPHPRMHLRAFVLVPLLEIAPGCRIPGRGDAGAWLPAVRAQRIEKFATTSSPSSLSFRAGALTIDSLSRPSIRRGVQENKDCDPGRAWGTARRTAEK